MMRMCTLGVILGAVLVGFSGCGSAVAVAEPAPGDPPAPVYKFELEVDGAIVGGFTMMDGLSIEMEVVEFEDGEDKQVRKRPGRLKYSNIVLKKGYLTEGGLRDWWEEILGGAFMPKAGVITILDADGAPVDRFNFYEGWPCKWKGFSRDEDGGDSLIEEVEICVERLERVRPPAPVPPRADER